MVFRLLENAFFQLNNYCATPGKTLPQNPTIIPSERGKLLILPILKICFPQQRKAGRNYTRRSRGIHQQLLAWFDSELTHSIHVKDNSRKRFLKLKFPIEFLLNNTEIMCKQYKRKQIPFFRNTIKNIVLFSKSLCQPKALTKNTKTFHLTAFQTQIISNIELVSNLLQKFPKSTGILGEKLVDKY